MLAWAASFASAQKTEDLKTDLKATITIESGILTKGQPGIVHVVVTNTTDRELEINATASFELLKATPEAIARKFRVVEDSFWGPVDLLAAKPLKLDLDPKMAEKGIVSGRVHKALLHFNPKETKTFDVDLTKVLWNATMLSDWPRWSLFERVPKGPYSLVLELQGSVRLTSNEIAVSIE